MIKLIENKKYRITFKSGGYRDCLYAGTTEHDDCACNECGKFRTRLHWFYYGENLKDIDEVEKINEMYHYGTECIKKVKIVPAES